MLGIGLVVLRGDNDRPRRWRREGKSTIDLFLEVGKGEERLVVLASGELSPNIREPNAKLILVTLSGVEAERLWINAGGSAFRPYFHPDMHESGDVTAIVEGMKAVGARYVYASDHSISTRVDYDDFKFAIEVYREHMLY